MPDGSALLLTRVYTLLSYFSLCLIFFSVFGFHPGQTPRVISHLLRLLGVIQLLTLLGLDDLDSSEESWSGVP